MRLPRKILEIEKGDEERGGVEAAQVVEIARFARRQWIGNRQRRHRGDKRGKPVCARHSAFHLDPRNQSEEAGAGDGGHNDGCDQIGVIVGKKAEGGAVGACEEEVVDVEIEALHPVLDRGNDAYQQRQSRRRVEGESELSRYREKRQRQRQNAQRHEGHVHRLFFEEVENPDPADEPCRDRQGMDEKRSQLQDEVAHSGRLQRNPHVQLCRLRINGNPFLTLMRSGATPQPLDLPSCPFPRIDPRNLPVLAGG